MTAPAYALYWTSRFGAEVKFARVRIMGPTDKAGRVPVRVTSNRHPAVKHGALLRVSANSLSGHYNSPI